MNDHSPLTDSCSSAGCRPRARLTVPSQSCSRISQASRKPAESVGRIFGRSGERLSSSASTSGPMSTPLILRLAMSAWMSTLTRSTPRITTPVMSTLPNRALLGINRPELSPGEVDLLEPGAAKILVCEMSHCLVARTDPRERHVATVGVVGVGQARHSSPSCRRKVHFRGSYGTRHGIAPDDAAFACMHRTS